MYELIPLIFVFGFILVCAVIAIREGKANKKEGAKTKAENEALIKKHNLSKRTKV